MGRDRERKRERNINVTEAHQLVASHICPHQSRDWTCNPGTGSWVELNLQPSSVQDDVLTTEPRRPGQSLILLTLFKIKIHFTKQIGEIQGPYWTTGAILFSLSPTSIPTGIRNGFATLSILLRWSKLHSKTPHDSAHQTPPISWNWTHGIKPAYHPRKEKWMLERGKTMKDGKANSVHCQQTLFRAFSEKSGNPR